MPNWLRVLGWRIRGIYGRRRLDEDFQQELDSHLEMLTEENIRRGLPPEEARRTARVRLGGLTQLRETNREMWGLPWPETLFQDLRYGLRQLRRNPGFTIVAVLTLALGIGANTAIFSVLDTVLLKPFPYPGAGRMIVLYESMSKSKGMLLDSWPDFVDWRTGSHSFEQIVALSKQRVLLSGLGPTRMIPALFVSKSFFSFFGTTPILGRTFSETEAEGGGAPVAVASHSFWQEALHGDKDAVGMTIVVYGQPFTLIGVLPPGFELPFPTRFDLYLPFGKESSTRGLTAGLKARANHPFLVYAKLQPGVTLKRARVEMDTIMARLGSEYPKLDRGEEAVLIPLMKQVVGKAGGVLILLLGATGFVLLLACVNVGQMALARSATRQREFAVRASLGAGHRRLARQLFMEHLPLVVSGGVVGVGFAAISLRPLVQMYPGFLFRLPSVHLNWSVLLFVLGVCTVAWLLFGLAPAIEVRRDPDLNESLKEGGYGGSGTKGWRLRSALSAAEIAIALVLVVGTSLLLRSLAAVMEVNPGFRADHLLAVSVLRLGPGNVDTNYSDVLKRLKHLPGVKSVGATLCPPLHGWRGISPYVPNGRGTPVSAGQPWTAMNIVTPNYFRTLETPLLAGRFFTEADDARSRPVAIVNQTMARTVGPLRNVIGKRIFVRYLPHPVVQIVGVVRDIKQFNMIRPDMPEVYVPFAQRPLGNMTFMVRSSVNPRGLANTVIRSIHDLDKSQPVPKVTIMKSAVKSALGNRPFVALLMSLFTALSLLLAAVGVAGVTAYTVAERTHEIGVRAALGARCNQVVRMILWQTMWPVLLGVVVGLGAAWGLTRLMASLLYGVKTHDPLTFAIATLVLIGVSLVACYIPARRAAKVDPMVALRYE